jgi:N6-adenosine-specific RNA methylase IME4
VGLRGKAAPVWLPESVIPVPRDGLIHSQKPAEFYGIIERMFPSFRRRLELFARREQPNWDGWGNQYPGTNSNAELCRANAA